MRWRNEGRLRNCIMGQGAARMTHCEEGLVEEGVSFGSEDVEGMLEGEMIGSRLQYG